MEINKKMLLCAMVGGDEQALTQMREVRYDDRLVRCAHTTPISLAIPESLSGCIGVEVNIVTVELKPIVGGNEVAGRVARCSCGKIYYSLND